MSCWSIFSVAGQRKYLTPAEVRLFLQSAQKQGAAIYALCWVVAATGCRISEALAMNEANIDFAEKLIVIRCLKKREKIIYRAIPVSDELIRHLKKWMDNGTLPKEKFWPISRMTAYRRIVEVMDDAGVNGDYASPKGLRHAFGIKAIQSGVPLNLVQRWLGHADIKTTAIYTSAYGPEERAIAARMW